MQINRVQNNNPSFKAVKLEGLNAPLKRAVVESPAIKSFIESNEKRLLNTEIITKHYESEVHFTPMSHFIVRSVVPNRSDCIVDTLMDTDYYRSNEAVDAIKAMDAGVGLSQKVKEFYEWVESLSRKYSRD